MYIYVYIHKYMSIWMYISLKYIYIYIFISLSLYICVSLYISPLLSDDDSDRGLDPIWPHGGISSLSSLIAALVSYPIQQLRWDANSDGHPIPPSMHIRYAQRGGMATIDPIHASHWAISDLASVVGCGPVEGLLPHLVPICLSEHSLRYGIL